MKRITIKAFIVTIFTYSLLLAQSIQAGVIYDEDVSGDLRLSDTTLLNLLPGVNSILGSSETSNITTDFDAFLFTLKAGLTLQSVNYFAFNLDAPNISILFVSHKLREGGHGGTVLASSPVDLLNTPQSMFSTRLPLSVANTYGFSVGTFVRSGNGGSWDYEIQLTTIPEPNTFAIFCLGLVGLGFPRHNKV